ncbi:MAG TPA: Rdx family protein [Candidatus Udaeobacter sp.]|nr:Rdx family protein [Candidatus Udaeobacter sp.]
MAAKILELGERIKSLSLIPSRGGAFEVRANGKLLHSKLDSGEWPDFDEIVKAVKKA